MLVVSACGRIGYDSEIPIIVSPDAGAPATVTDAASPPPPTLPSCVGPQAGLLPAGNDGRWAPRSLPNRCDADVDGGLVRAVRFPAPSWH